VHQVCKCTLYAYNLCRHFVHSKVSAEKVCIKSVDVHLMHTFCKDSAYFMHTLECISIRFYADYVLEQ
jgi:hypothetical protein